MAAWSPFRRPGAPRFRRGSGQAFWAGLGLLTAAVLILFQSGNPAALRIQLWVNELASPVLEVVRMPFDAAVEAISSAKDLAKAHGTANALRRELAEVKAERDRLQLMQQENSHLRALLGLVAPGTQAVATVRATGSAGGAFVQNLLISGGTRLGIDKDMIVTDGQGLAGRVIDSGPFTSRVLLITDYNSRIPVRFERSGQMAILAGQNSMTLEVVNMAPDYRPRVGERLVTSGHGGIFPHDIPAAIVTRVSPRGVEARAAAALDSINYLRILKRLPEPILPPANAPRLPLPSRPQTSEGTAPSPEAGPGLPPETGQDVSGGPERPSDATAIPDKSGARPQAAVGLRSGFHP